MKLGKAFLPVSKEDMKKRGWEQCDIILVTGDAYIDHPSFGTAIISRVLEAKGFRVGIISQPNWKTDEDFLKLGQPRLFFGVNSGNLDSMVNHFTAAKKPRREDAYTPGGKAGKRPDRAVVVYSNRLRQLFGKVPIVIGGIEASLRRFAHYDYWDDKVRHSILVDSGADLLIYGMGETAVIDIAAQLHEGKTMGDLKDIRGTVFRQTEKFEDENAFLIPSYDDVVANKKQYARAFRKIYEEQDPIRGKTIVQKNGKQYIIQNPPGLPLPTGEIDWVYELPYTRMYHPDYEKEGGVPALKEVRFSMTSHRGCFGECSFCALLSHQGKIIQSRSKESLVAEAKLLTTLPDFKGYIHDVGGPTANFWGVNCERQTQKGSCKGKHCLFPKPCPNLPTDQSHIIDMLATIRELPKVKKVFVRSGIRYDFALAEKSGGYLKEICEHHVSGQLKVAPEHVSPIVTSTMRKPGVEEYDHFRHEYERINKKLGKKQYIVPYFMSSHPGCDMKEMVKLAEYIRDLKYRPEQVQDFTPTPLTVSTCMYYTGLNPFTMKPVYVAKNSEEKAMQRALMQYRDPRQRLLVEKALRRAGRTDLIGYSSRSLIKPKQEIKAYKQKNKRGKLKKRHK